jgi:hypothetical protein
MAPSRQTGRHPGPGRDHINFSHGPGPLHESCRSASLSIPSTSELESPLRSLPLGAIRVNFRLVPLQFNGADFFAPPPPHLCLSLRSPRIWASRRHTRLPGMISTGDGQ